MAERIVHDVEGSLEVGSHNIAHASSQDRTSNTGHVCQEGEVEFCPGPCVDVGCSDSTDTSRGLGQARRPGEASQDSVCLRMPYRPLCASACRWGLGWGLVEVQRSSVLPIQCREKETKAQRSELPKVTQQVSKGAQTVFFSIIAYSMMPLIRRILFKKCSFIISKDLELY